MTLVEPSPDCRWLLLVPPKAEPQARPALIECAAGAGALSAAL